MIRFLIKLHFAHLSGYSFALFIVFFAVLFCSGCAGGYISSATPRPTRHTATDTPIPTATTAPTTTPKDITFAGKKYTLTFNDDFDHFDERKWAHCPEQERQDAGGEWRDSCCEVRDGNLVISCTIDKDGTPISGGIRSTGEYEQAFGLYNIRFKVEKADGLWYAFWLLTDKMEEGLTGNGATDGAELDIFEYVPHTDEFSMSVHWDGYEKDLKSAFETYYPGEHYPGGSFFDRWHEVWYLWDEYGYRLYLDGTDDSCLVFDFPGDGYGDGTCAVPCDMIISAEFGSWGGDIDTAQLPAHFYIDHVRVYKMN